jgi:hypothetical protein
MASSLIVLSNAIVNQQTSSAPGGGGSGGVLTISNANNSNDLNTNTSNTNESSHLNKANGSRVSSENVVTPSLPIKSSIVTIANNDRINLPPLNLSTSPIKSSVGISDETAIMSPKMYISTHQLKFSNNNSTKESHTHNSTSSASNVSSFDNGLDNKSKVTTIANGTPRENSAKIKIKYNYNNSNLNGLAATPLHSPNASLSHRGGGGGVSVPFYGPLDSPNSLSNKKLRNEMDTRSSSSPSSSLASNHSEPPAVFSPTLNLPIGDSSYSLSKHTQDADGDDLPRVYLDDNDEHHTITDVNLVMESNKLHLAIVKPNVLRRSTSYVVNDDTNENTMFNCESQIPKMR